MDNWEFSNVNRMKPIALLVSIGIIVIMAYSGYLLFFVKVKGNEAVFAWLNIAFFNFLLVVFRPRFYRIAYQQGELFLYSKVVFHPGAVKATQLTTADITSIKAINLSSVWKARLEIYYQSEGEQKVFSIRLKNFRMGERKQLIEALQQLNP